MAELPAIEAWRATLPETQRLRLNHPDTVLRNYRKAIGAGAASECSHGTGVPVGANLSLASAPLTLNRWWKLCRMCSLCSSPAIAGLALRLPVTHGARSTGRNCVRPTYNGKIEVHSSPLNVVLHDQPRIRP
jgi:hypothetical protein